MHVQFSLAPRGVSSADGKGGESNFSRRRLGRFGAWREIGLIPFSSPTGGRKYVLEDARNRDGWMADELTARLIEGGP